MRSWLRAVVVFVAIGLVLSGCSPARTDRMASVSRPASPGPSRAAPPIHAGPGPTTRSARSRQAVDITLAFAGDVHFAGSSAAALTSGLGSGAAPLARADPAVVNLETAVTSRGQPASKQYTFRAPAPALQVLRRAGVDAVSLANNHGLDYGEVGLRDTLAASHAYGLPVIGAGVDERSAFAGVTRVVRGVRVSVVSATDVIDSSLVSAWTAGPDHPGLASAKAGPALADRVRELSATSDVVVVFLHWGQELVGCPTERQRALAQELVAAGADLVVGSHAHVLEPLDRVDGVPVAYGLGNFVFYANAGPTARSGVLVVRASAVPGSAAAGHPRLTAAWHSATIVSGRPVADRPGASRQLPLC